MDNVTWGLNGLLAVAIMEAVNIGILYRKVQRLDDLTRRLANCIDESLIDRVSALENWTRFHGRDLDKNLQKLEGIVARHQDSCCHLVDRIKRRFMAK